MNERLIEVKRGLCLKYRRLAALTKSEPRRKNLLNKSLGYREQVIKLGGTL
jgi:hypothetical protein